MNGMSDGRDMGKANEKSSFWSRRKKKRQSAHVVIAATSSHGRRRSATIEAFSNGELDLKGLLEKHKTPLKPKETSDQASRLLPSLKVSLQSSVCLAYFLEYLQHGNSKDLLDFWLAVEAFKAVARQRMKLRSRSKSHPKEAAILLAADLEAEKTCVELEQLCITRKADAYARQTRDTREHSQHTNDHVAELKFGNDWHPFAGVTSVGTSTDCKTEPTLHDDRRDGGATNENSYRRTKSFIGDALSIYERYLSLDAPCKIDLEPGIRQSIEGNLCQSPDSIDPECFASAQSHVFSLLETHHTEFLRSHWGRKFQLNVITSKKPSLQDMVYDDMALFYFTEFTELESSASILEFWLIAENFERELQSRLKAERYDIEECLEDSMAIYDKYFSMQSPTRLIFDDKLRIVLENNICRADGPQPNCFCIPMAYAWTAMKDIYFPRFLTSDIYARYVKDLERSSECRPEDDESTTSSELQATCNAASLADSSSEWDLLDMDSESIWQRPGTGRLALGHVDKFGIFHSESEPEPDRKTSRQREGGSKFRSAMKRFIANESVEVDEEQLAMERAQKIIEDVQKLNNLS